MRNGDRRKQDRRTQARSGADRRRRDRRRGAAGGLILTGLALAGALHHRGTPSEPTGDVASESARPGVSPDKPDSSTDQAGDATAKFDDIIQEASTKYGVNPDLVRAVIRAESNFDPLAKSRVGAQGLMQLMPKVARELGISNPFDARENIFGGTKYLSQLLERHDGDVKLALASFNAGPRNVAKYHGVPPFKETRGYVKKITGFLADASADAADAVRGAAD